MEDTDFPLPKMHSKLGYGAVLSQHMQPTSAGLGGFSGCGAQLLRLLLLSLNKLHTLKHRSPDQIRMGNFVIFLN